MRLLASFPLPVSSENFIADIEVLPCFSEDIALQELLDVAVFLLQEAQRTALNVLSAKEKTALIQCVNSWWITPFSMVTGETLSMEIEAYIVYDEGLFMEFSNEVSISFVRKLLALSAQEALALVLWAKKFWGKYVDLEEYIA